MWAVVIILSIVVCFLLFALGAVAHVAIKNHNILKLLVMIHRAEIHHLNKVSETFESDINGKEN
jgi:hypothetical protein